MKNSIETKKLTSVESIKDHTLVKKFKNYITQTLDANNMSVKDYQKILNNYLKKQDKYITVDGKIWWQTLAATQMFLKTYNNNSSYKIDKNNMISSVADVVSEVRNYQYKLEHHKNQQIKHKFENTAKQIEKTHPKESQKAQEELQNIDKQKHQEQQEVINTTQKELKNHQTVILTDQKLKEILVKNEKWEFIPVKIAKWIDDKFTVESKKKHKIEFHSKDDLIPFNFNINVTTILVKDDNDDIETDLLWNIKYKYNFWLDLPKKEWVNFYKKEVSWDKNINQVYYSFKKEWKIYLWVIWFNFNSDNWQITNFRTSVKEIKNYNKILTKKELKKYEDSIYDTWIFDSDWYTIESWTIINNVNHMDVGTWEKTYDKLKEKYSDENNLKLALKLIWTKIATNTDLRINFPVWWADKEWIWTWDILWAIITLKWLKESWLDKELKFLYEQIDKWTITKYEIDYITKDMERYPNIEKFKTKEKIKWLSDINDSGKIGDMTNTIIWEKTIFENMNNLPEGKINWKITEILSLSGCPDELKNTYFAKAYFYRWLKMLNLSPLALQKYLSGKMSLKQVEQESLKLQKESRHKMLVYYVWEKKAEELESKMKWKYVELAQELNKRLPEKYKNDPTILERLKNSIDYVWMTAAYIDHTRKQDTIWWAVNFGTDWGIIDNLSLWVVSNNWQLIPWIALSKSFTKKFSEKLSSIWIWWTLVNGVIPLLSVSASHDFNNSGLKDWTSSSKKIIWSVWTAFPIMFWSLWYNFGRAGQMEYKEAKLDSVLNRMFAKLKNGEKLKEKDYTDKYEKELVRSINSMLESMNISEFSKPQKEEIYKTIKQGIEQNYSHLTIESNKWTRLSEVGLIWAVIPLVYAKMESIKVKYSLDKNSSSHLVDGINDIEKNWKHEKIISLKWLKSQLEKILWESIVEIKEWNIFLNLDNIPKWTILAFGNGLTTKIVWNKLKIWWSLSGNIVSTKINTPWKHSNIIWIWGWFFTEWFGKNRQSKLTFSNSLEKNNEWKIDLSWFNDSEKVDKLKIALGAKKEILLDNQYLEEQERFKRSWLYKLIENNIDGWIFVSTSNKVDVSKFLKEYSHLVLLSKEYNYNEAIDYISTTIFRRWSSISSFICNSRWWQKQLNKMRTELNGIKNSKDNIKKQIVVEKILNNFFLDKHIKTKSNYLLIKKNVEDWFNKFWIKYTESWYKLPDHILKKISKKNKKNWGIQNWIVKIWKELILESVFEKIWEKILSETIHKWYTARMSMKEFDTIDLAETTSYNRTAWFLRSVRNELLWWQNTLGWHLDITWVKWVKRIEHVSKSILSKTSQPVWFTKLDTNTKDKVMAFCNIVIAGEKYISKKWFEKSTIYKNISVSNIIAFPFTYKLAVHNEHGHVPMYWRTDLVDVNQDGKFDENDYTEINSKEVNQYIYSMLSSKFKDSLQDIIKEKKWIILTGKQLESLFVNKHLTINNKTINISYKTIFTKWWECFNSTLAMIDLQFDGVVLWVSVVGWNVYLNNQADNDIDNYTLGIGRKVEPEPTPEPTSESEPTPEPTSESEPTPEHNPQNDIDSGQWIGSWADGDTGSNWGGADF